MFNSDTGTLSTSAPDNDASPIVLTLTASRLLQLLLTHQGEILSRDFLMENAWTKYNFKPSNASLNNNIAILRKSLNSLGAEDDLIITHPKMGIELQCNISVIDDTLCPPERSSIAGRITPSVIVIFCLITLLAIATLFIRSKPGDVSPYKSIGRIDSCSLYLIRTSRAVSLDFVKKNIANLNINCKNTIKDLYFDVDGVDRARAKNLFVFACVRAEKDKYVSCENFILYTERSSL
ncbi:helix-turn-helix domain-containing protein [Enterobacter sp. SLBN-59]|uniref:winged helix-turn-helix domain-containing protein n=1 Tax=Enterobacter sp. SLBN-59 TaxID=2940621 RepID=UPI002169533F|nr:helix-turn-helix domain-containing protein [Enterobacter sp. SLBN-59]MCS3490730.1 DNA-binding winged helix-turn-helix (wHTH) protein [Enterobacter sp. SLBN-59]